MDETFEVGGIFEAHTDGNDHTHIWFKSGKDAGGHDKLEKLKFLKPPKFVEFHDVATKRIAQMQKEYDDRKAAEADAKAKGANP